MKRIGILVVAYNAASTLAQVLDRIPRDFVPRIDEVPSVDVHVLNRFQESGYLATTLEGKVERAYPYAP